jgi:hypothetical protein
MMINKLATDRTFRELVRAIVAYIEDPDQWGQEVEKIVKRSIPKSDVDRFRKEILKRNPGMDSLADYFDIVAPKNPQQLAEMVKSMYWGIFDPTRAVGKPMKKKPEMVTEIAPEDMTPTQKRIQQLQQENLELEQYGKSQSGMKEYLEKIRAQRPSIARTARLNVINAYLDSLV